jgi:hypothetical protein
VGLRTRASPIKRYGRVCDKRNLSKRKPLTPRLASAVYRRDLWLCRCCKKPVIFPQAMKFLDLEVKRSGWTTPTALFHAH